MAHGHENLIPFSKRSKEEARKYGSQGGKASGESRRKKSDFRKTLNILLTTKIDSDEWTPLLEAMGLDSTLESAVNMAMIKEALAGNVKAYEAIAKFTGQSAKTEADEQEQAARTRGVELDNVAKEGQVKDQEESGLGASIVEAYEKRRECQSGS